MIDLALLVRIVAITELVVMVACGVYLYDTYKPLLPNALRQVTPAFAAPLVFTGCAVALNGVLGVGLTPGATLFAVLTLPSALWIAYRVWMLGTKDDD